MPCLRVTDKYMHKRVYKLLQKRTAWGPSPEEESDETLEEVWEVTAQFLKGYTGLHTGSLEERSGQAIGKGRVPEMLIGVMWLGC